MQYVINLIQIAGFLTTRDHYHRSEDALQRAEATRNIIAGERARGTAPRATLPAASVSASSLQKHINSYFKSLKIANAIEWKISSGIKSSVETCRSVLRYLTTHARHRANTHSESYSPCAARVKSLVRASGIGLSSTNRTWLNPLSKINESAETQKWIRSPKIQPQIN
jgi:hypothetical protein